MKENENDLYGEQRQRGIGLKVDREAGYYEGRIEAGEEAVGRCEEI